MLIGHEVGASLVAAGTKNPPGREALAPRQGYQAAWSPCRWARVVFA
jgi:hypothetical protein